MTPQRLDLNTDQTNKGMKCRWRNTGEWNEWINTGNRDRQIQDRRGGRIRLVRSMRI